jgi:hypothetical protein
MRSDYRSLQRASSSNYFQMHYLLAELAYPSRVGVPNSLYRVSPVHPGKLFTSSFALLRVPKIRLFLLPHSLARASSLSKSP